MANGRGRGRPSLLNDPVKADQIAEMFADGASRKEIASTFGIKDVQTVTRWRTDPRIESRVRKLINARVVMVTTKVDAVIAGRLQHADKMTIKELLDVRKEYLGGALREQTEKADDSVLTAAMEALERDPELLDKMSALLDSSEAPRTPTDVELQGFVNEQS